MPRNRVRHRDRRHDVAAQRHRVPPRRCPARATASPVDLAVGAAAAAPSTPHDVARRPRARLRPAPTQSRAASRPEVADHAPPPPAAPTRRRGRRPPRPSATAGCARSRVGDRGRGHVDAAGDDHVVGAAEHRAAGRPVETAEVLGDEPAVRAAPAAVRSGSSVVPVEQHRPADPHPAVVADRDRDAVERHAVVDAAAAGLAHAVGRHDADARASASARSRSRGSVRAAADQHGVEAAQRDGLRRVVEQPGQLGRAPARRSAAPPSSAPPRSRGRRPGRPARCRRARSGRAPAGPRRTSAAGSAATGRARRAAPGSPSPRRASRRGRAPRRLGSPVDPEVAITSGSGSSAACQSRSSARISSAVPDTGVRLLTSAHGAGYRACKNPPPWLPLHSGSRARAPAPCPPPSRPVLAGTGVAACLDDGRLVEGRARAGGLAGPAGRASTTPTTTPTASAAPTPTGSARCGWSAPASPRPAAVKRAAFAVLRRRLRGRPGARRDHVVVAGRGRRGQRGRRLVLHRRLQALRLPRPRRGDGVRVLRPGRGHRARRTSRPSRSTLAALYAAVGIGALACAILVANNLRDIPTDREVGKRTLAVVARRRPHPRRFYALLVLLAAARAASRWR